MRKKLIILLVSALALASCVDNNYRLTDNIDMTIGSDMTIVGPIGQSHMKLIELLPDVLNSFKIKVDGDEIIFSKQDTEHLGNEIFGKIKMFPKSEFNDEATIYSKIVRIGMFTCPVDYTFSEINKDGEASNERLDSILYSENQILHITFSSDVYLTSQSRIIVSGNDEYFQFDKSRFPDNKQEFVVSGTSGSIDLDISKAVVKFNNGNTLKIEINGNLVSDKIIPEGSKIRFHSDYTNLRQRVTYGYLGPDRDLCDNIKTIDFNYLSELRQSDKTFLPFYNPIITLRGINSIGVPAEYKLKYVKLYNKTEEVYAQFQDGSKSTKFVLNYPNYNEISDMSHQELVDMDVTELDTETEFPLSRENGATDRLFKIKGEKLQYAYSIRPIVPNTAQNVAYFFDDSNIDVYLDTQIAARFEGNEDDPAKNFCLDRVDTVKIDFTGLSLKESVVNLGSGTVAKIKLRFKNHLPVGGLVHYSFVDETMKKVILPEKSGSAVLPEATIDDDGVVTKSAPFVYVYITLTVDEFNTLTASGKGILLNYTVSNSQLKDIWFKSNDWIDGKIEIWAKGFVTFNAN